jgi:hypothetical protein
MATAAADSEAPHIAAVAVAVVAVKNLMMVASTIAAEVAALPITMVAAVATSTTPATRDETAMTTFLAKKVKEKAPVRPWHCSYLLDSSCSGDRRNRCSWQSVLITCLK